MKRQILQAILQVAIKKEEELLLRGFSELEVASGKLLGLSFDQIYHTSVSKVPLPNGDLVHKGNLVSRAFELFGSEELGEIISLSAAEQKEGDIIKAAQILATLKSEIFSADRDTVRQLQEGLIADGYDLGKAGADGIIGEKTMPAIVDFSVTHSHEISAITERLEREEAVTEVVDTPVRER